MNNVPNLRFNEFSGEWESLKISETLKIKHGRDQKKIQVEDGIYPILATGGEIGRTNIPLYDKESVLIGRKGTIDKPIYMNSPFWTVDTLFYSEIKNNIVPKFIFYKFQNINWRKYCEASGVPSLSASTIEGIRYNVPQKQEQEKIASFFSLIDKKIELQTEKVEELKNYKKGIMQKIFSQELRFKDENGNDYPSWTKCKIYDCFVERSEKGFEDLELLSVSMERGVIKRSEIESKDNSSENKSNYKLVKKGDIVYNSMRMWQGASGLSEYEGIVSPAYTVLTPKKDIYSNYFSYLFKMHTMIHEFRKYSQGLTSDTWNLKYPQIKDIKVNVPSYEEQVKISQFFMKLDIKIEKEQDNLKCLIEYKKGLLQQMFI